MNQRFGLNRRSFLAATAASMTLPQRLYAGANDRMRVAFVGVGGRGRANFETINRSKAIDVVAICDVNQRSLDAVAQRVPEAKQFQDYRKMYDDLGDRFDAAVISTTEHTHAYATMPALKLGKHVYCEKPLAYNIAETRAIADAAQQAGSVTQMGTQIHAGKNYRRVVELIQSGAIGDVSEAHVWVGRAWGLQSKEEALKNKDRLFVERRPKEVMDPPKHLNWDLWLGPAPYRPYHSVYFPGPNWYRWWDFGNGTMSDLGSHYNDLPFWALKLDAPKTVEAFGAEPHPEIAPASMKAIYQFGSRGKLPPTKLFWYQGHYKPDLWQQNRIPQWSSGILFVGSKGMLLSSYTAHLLLPEEEFQDFEAPEPFIADSPGHHQEWLLACQGQGVTGSPFSYAGPLTEANHLGNVAYRVGKRITWDSRRMRCVDCPEAEPFIERVPRAGWEL